MTRKTRWVAAGLLIAIGVGCAGRSSPDQTASTTRPAGLVASPRSKVEILSAAKRDVYWLADDARGGRGLGTDGLAQAGDYIADRFARFGLKPLPGLNGYFQYFEHNVGGRLGSGTTLSVNGKALPREQFTALVRSKPGEMDLPLAFVGYGAKDDEKGYDDFAGIDVKGHAVLIMRWEPVDENGKSRWSDDGFSRAAAIQRKVSNAVSAGAKAVILVNAPRHIEDVEPLLDPQSGLRGIVSVPVYHVTTEAADNMLSAAGAPSLSALQAKIDSEQKPSSMVLGNVQVAGAVQIERDTTSVRNVVAYLPGKGPNADEYIVIGAHYDHVGKGFMGSRAGGGEIHNGADDNASGTTALLQLAENFALVGQQDRSIVFVAFTLEELGLIGSRKFVDAEVIPNASTVAMLNLDMVGRIANDKLFVGGTGTAESFESILNELDAASPLEIRSMGRGGRGPSDHQSFSAKEIPVLFFFSGMHVDYHAPGDDAPKVNYEGLTNVIALSFDLVQRLCEMPRQAYVSKYDGQQPDVNVAIGGEPGARSRDREMIEPDRPRLGIVPDYTTEPRTDGILISGVTDDTAAAAAGLKAGDVITQLNDRKVASLEDVVEFINGSKVGDKVVIHVLRGGQSMQLESTLKGRPSAQ